MWKDEVQEEISEEKRGCLEDMDSDALTQQLKKIIECVTELDNNIRIIANNININEEKSNE